LCQGDKHIILIIVSIIILIRVVTALIPISWDTIPCRLVFFFFVVVFFFLVVVFFFVYFVVVFFVVVVVVVDGTTVQRSTSPP